MKHGAVDAADEDVAPGRYRKKARSRLAQAPNDVIAALATRREGKIEVRHPDDAVVGADNKVYANTAPGRRRRLSLCNARQTG